MDFNKNKIFLFTLFAFVVVLTQYESPNHKEYKLAGKSILHLDEKVFENFSKRYNEKGEFRNYWGFKEKKVPKRIKDKNSTAKFTIVQQKKNQNTICIEEMCFSFLGVYSQNQNKFASFYTSKAKEKVKDYIKNDILYMNIYIKDIKQDRLTIADYNTTREWNFTLFDVNQTKYKPKEKVKNE